MFYSEYRGRCIGRVMFFLYGYTHRADDWTYNDKRVTNPRNGLLVATYEWDSEDPNDPNYDVPTFKFSKEHEWLEQQQQELKQKLIDFHKPCGPTQGIPKSVPGVDDESED